MRKKLVPEEKAICNVVNVYRERGNYLQRLEQFEKAILAYNEALRWNNADVRSLLGRSQARAKATHYVGALADAVRAAELEPENLTALQIRAQTEYEKCAFERSLVVAQRGRRLRRYPPDFDECARHAEETVRECVGKNAAKVLQSAVPLLRLVELKRESTDTDAPLTKHRSRIAPQVTQQTKDISRAEKQKSDHMSRLMSSKYLERMAHEKYFLKDLCKDERLVSANKKGSVKLQELAQQAFADLNKRQSVLRERRPMYAARASEAAARARLQGARKEQAVRAQKQHVADAKRLVQATVAMFEKHDFVNLTKTRERLTDLAFKSPGKVCKVRKFGKIYKKKNILKKRAMQLDGCLENAEFAMDQIYRKPSSLLPGKDKYLEQLHDLIGNAFLDQKRVAEEMSEAERERRAFVFLGISISRENSRDSLLRQLPPSPPRDVKQRLRHLDRALGLSTRATERCYLLHELARLHVDIKQPLRARFYAIKCQSEARAAGLRAWLLNATFLFARSDVMQNNRPEARAALLEGAALARSFGYTDISAFFDTCANVSLEGEILAGDAALEKREKAMVSLMQDEDLKSEAQHLFRRMSTIPAGRRFSIMPGVHVDETVPPSARRASIMPRTTPPVRLAHKAHHPLGYQDFDL